MVAPLELTRTRLLVFLWDKMLMKMVILLCRCVMSPCVKLFCCGVHYFSSLSNIFSFQIF